MSKTYSLPIRIYYEDTDKQATHHQRLGVSPICTTA